MDGGKVTSWVNEACFQTTLSRWVRPKKSLLSGHKSVSKSAQWHPFFCGNLFIFCQAMKERDTYFYWNQTKFPIHKVWWIREASQIEQTFIPHVKSCLKHSTAEFQLIQQFLAAIGHCFIAKQIFLNKCRCAGLRGPETRGTFLLA